MLIASWRWQYHFLRHQLSLRYKQTPSATSSSNPTSARVRHLSPRVICTDSAAWTHALLLLSSWIIVGSCFQQGGIKGEGALSPPPRTQNFSHTALTCFFEKPNTHSDERPLLPHHSHNFLQITTVTLQTSYFSILTSTCSASMFDGSMSSWDSCFPSGILINFLEHFLIFSQQLPTWSIYFRFQHPDWIGKPTKKLNFSWRHVSWSTFQQILPQNAGWNQEMISSLAWRRNAFFWRVEVFDEVCISRFPSQ